MRQAVQLKKRFWTAKLRPALVLVLCWGVLGIASRATALQHFYEPSDLAASREVNERVVTEINKTNKELAGKKASVLDGAAMLNGANRFSITVLDDKTRRPITEYVIHGVIVGRQADRYFPGGIPMWPGGLEKLIKEGKFKLVDKVVGIGRLESKQVKDAAGRCLYEGLGRLEVEFQIWAKGYVPLGLQVKIPDAGASATVKLIAAGSLRGRMLDIDGAPLQQAKIELNYPDEHEGNHTWYRCEIKTGADGSFLFPDLPPDQYILRFPELPGSSSDIVEKIDDRLREEARQNPAHALEPPERARRRAELLAKPCPQLPHVEGIAVQAGQNIDLGAIRLERAPILELQIVGQDCSPLVNFPFEIAYPGQEGYDYPYRSRTDDAGKACIALPGWRPGPDAVIFTPEAMKEKFQTKRRKTETRPVIYLTHSDKEIFEQAQSSWHAERVDEDGKEIPKKWDAFTAEQKAEYHETYEKERSDGRKRAAAADARPDHPNYELFTPRNGQVSKVRLVFHPPQGTMNPRLVFRDKSNGQPIPEFRGVISFGGIIHFLLTDFDWGLRSMDKRDRLFRSADRSGRVTLSNLTLPPGFLAMEQRYLESLNPKVNFEKRSGDIQGRTVLVIEAPGYVRQVFEVRTAQLSAGADLTFDLEPEARVVGRVMIGETGEPLNKETLKALLVREMKWTERLAQFWPNLRAFRVCLENKMVNGDPWLSRDLHHYADFGFGEIGSDGRFEVHGIRPHDQWGLVVQATEIPEYSRTGLTLKPGLNDLGDIRVGGEGCLTLKVIDGQGRPLPGVRLKWPLGLEGSSSDDKILTDAAGGISFGLRPLRGDRQVLRLAPPWGLADRLDDPEHRFSKIMYDAVLNIDRTAAKNIETRLERGHILRIELERTPARDELARVFQRATRSMWPGKPVPTFLAIRCAFLQSLKPSPEGFVYHQMAGVYGGIPFTSSTMALQVDNVPPGRYALCLVGSTYTYPLAPGPKNTFAMDRGMGLPLAYTELEMAPTTTTVKLELNPVDVEIARDQPPLQPQPKPDETIIFMDRTEPISTFFGGDNRRVFASMQSSIGKPAEEMMTPMVGYCDGFSLMERYDKAIYHPILFRAVPPGDYRIEAYAKIEDAYAKPPRPYFKKAITVERNGPKIRIAVPKP